MYLNDVYLTDAYKAIKEIPDKSVDLIYTDVPYEISVDHGAGAFGVKKRWYHTQYIAVSENTEKTKINRSKHLQKASYNDIQFGIDYSILEEFCRVLKEVNVYIWCSKKQILPLMKYFVDEKGCFFEIITWHKTNPIPTVNNTYLSDTEYCLFFRKGAKLGGTVETKNKYYISPTNTSDKKKFYHPTIKPLAFVKNHILNSTKEGDVVLDPFAGSGTTLVAAKELGRQFIGFEFNGKWYKIASDRLKGIDAHGQISMFLR